MNGNAQAPSKAALKNLIKTYTGQAGRPFVHTAMVRHQGTVVAFAMNDERRIFYAVLDMSQEPTDAAPRPSLDVENWPGTPTELFFPNEIAEVGFGVADQALLPKLPGEKDLFRQTTARFSELASFQVLSDGRFVYLFRQSVEAGHPDNFFKKDKNGDTLFDQFQNPVALTDAQLLVDRFVLTGAVLSPKIEVRYQRSRSKNRPANRKDGLGPKDLDGNFFREPTQALHFVGNLTGGRFAVLILPTQVAGVERWQVFSQNKHSGQVECINAERSKDGLFNTRGTGERTEKGLAETAISFEKAPGFVEISAGIGLGAEFTQEAWIFPKGTQSVEDQVLISGRNSHAKHGPGIEIVAQTKLLLRFGDGNTGHRFTTKSWLVLNEWNHVAVVFDGTAYKVYIGGKLREKLTETDAGLAGQKPDPMNLVRFFGSADRPFLGKIDEVRFWQRPRSGREIAADMGQRLTGLEPALVGYWRFDEGEGDQVFDQTASRRNGKVTGGDWVASDAPIGENPGISRSCFQVVSKKGGVTETRKVASGMSASLYFQQSNVASGYAGKAKPLKQNARVMLTFATGNGAADDKNFIASLDFGVSAAGRIAAVPDNLPLELVAPPAAKPLSEQLDELSVLESAVRTANEALVLAQKKLAAAAALAQKLADASLNSVVTASGTSADGARKSLSKGPGDIKIEDLLKLGLNDRIDKIEIPERFRVTVFQHGDQTGSLEVFEETVEFGAADFWAGNISMLRIVQKPSFEKRLASAQANLNKALGAVSEKEKALAAATSAFSAAQNVVKTGAEVAMPLVRIDASGLSISGALLGFAWTADKPVLFDSATGSLALYFRGANDQFFVSYYTTFTEKAAYPLAGEDAQTALVCAARSNELEMDKIVLEISGPEKGPTCELTVSGAGVAEKWTKLPRDPERFARILNGQAGHFEKGKLVGYREMIGFAAVEKLGNELKMVAPLAQKLEAGASLMFGKQRVALSEAAETGAKSLFLIEILPAQADALPVFFMEYDYAANATTTKVPGDLFGGSLLVGALASPGAAFLANQKVSGGATASSKWTASGAGSTLAFQPGAPFTVGLPGSPQADPDTDMTLETWVKPAETGEKMRLLTHKSGRSDYFLALEKRQSAMKLDGSGHFELAQPVTVGAVFTFEAWVFPNSDEDRAMGIFGAAADKNGLFPPALSVVGKTGLSFSVTSPAETFGIGTGAVLKPGEWNHVAVSSDGKTCRLYVGGELKLANDPFAAHIPPTFSISQIGRADDFFFIGKIDDVRLWRAVRSGAEIFENKDGRLTGQEPNLAGYWFCENGTARDLTQNKNDGSPRNGAAAAAGALPFRFVAGVNGKVVQTRELIGAGEWAHLVAGFVPSFGRGFDGASHISCGNDASLNINGDLTLEVFFKANDFSRAGGLLSRGQFSDAIADQNVPYALWIDREGHAVFSFEDTFGVRHNFTSAGAFAPGAAQRVAVTRSRKSHLHTFEDALKATKTLSFVWDDIEIYLNDGPPEKFRNVVDNLVSESIKEVLEGKLDGSFIKKIGTWVVNGVVKAADIGRNDGAFEIGRVGGDFFRGIISEVRVWGKVRPAAELGADISGKESGLAGWWNFEERDGTEAKDSAGRNHGKFNGNLVLEKDPEPLHGKIRLFCNETTELALEKRPGADFLTHENQLTLGGLVQNGQLADVFSGELEDLRIWKTQRTAEQITDSMFRRLNGELEDLLAYYTFDPEDFSPSDGKTEHRLSDKSLNANNLVVSGMANYVLSTAPVGDDAPQIRSALAGVRTPFSGRIESAPAVQEYGDLQLDTGGNLIGVFKRCYGFVRDGNWHLVTGFKVGDIETEWIGQVQFAPQLVGFIEGAPPVPSENLTFSSVAMIGDEDDYNEASTVALVEASETTQTYTATKEGGIDLSVSAALHFGLLSQTTAGAAVGFATLSSIEESKLLIGGRVNFETSWNWMDEVSTAVKRSTGKTTSLELRGRFSTDADAMADREPFGTRFLPDNVGLALVKSRTADVIALRLRHNHALISFSMRANPDIPEDFNLINFPINPTYTKQGTLDGKIGPVADIDYPNALSYSPESSYFRPIEAYKLKNKILAEEAELETFYNNFNAKLRGSLMAAFPMENSSGAADLKAKLKRNLVNNYVWTSDGGLFAETHQVMDTQTETSAGEYEFQLMAGVDLRIGLAISKVAMQFELNAMFGGHMHFAVSKSRESSRSFELLIDVGKVERDIYERDANKIVVIGPDGRPRKMSGKVDAYRFMSFYLEDSPQNTSDFFEKVVDPAWLEQSNDPSAAALREAKQKAQPPSWRVMHRVTYVSRVLPRFETNAPPSIEKTMLTLDIDSNYELIKRFEPYLATKLGSLSEFTTEIHRVIGFDLPALKPHAAEVVQYLRSYFGIGDGPQTGANPTENESSELAPNQPPIVNAGLDQTIGLESLSVEADLEALVIDDRLEKTAALFLSWEKAKGPAEVGFAHRHEPRTAAKFTRRGIYNLKLTAHDGLAEASDELEVTVNEPPALDAGADLDLASNSAEITLTGSIIDSGLADETRDAKLVKVFWEKEGALGELEFGSPDALKTTVKFKTPGLYSLKLTVDNGTFKRSDSLHVAVAARVTAGLEALYTFEEGTGALVGDVSGKVSPIGLTIQNPSATSWDKSGFLKLNAPTVLTAAANPRLAASIKNTGELTLEAWVRPAKTPVSGLARVLSLSDGAASRNFTLGQNGDGFHLAIRTMSTNDNASNKALTGGPVPAENGRPQLLHLVATRGADGTARIFIDKKEAASRKIDGELKNWNEQFALSIGGDASAPDGIDRSWLGELHLVAVYSRALGMAEIEQNFNFGPNNDLPPVVSAGPDRELFWTDGRPNFQFQLEGRVSHDRKSAGGKPVWQQTSGPNTPNGVVFENKNEPGSKAVFSEKGRYLLRLTADDGVSEMNDEVVLTVHKLPEVDLKKSAHLALSGVEARQVFSAKLVDTGLAENNSPSAVTWAWRRKSGPGTVQILQPALPETGVVFAEKGIYELELTVSNGKTTASFPLAVTVNQMPVVSAGPNQTVNWPDAPLPGQTVGAKLAGTVSDKGLGDPSGGFSAFWETIDRPAGASVEVSADLKTVVFNQSGLYTLRFRAHADATPDASAFDDVQITVNRPPVVEVAPVPGPVWLVETPGLPALGKLSLEAIASDDGLPEVPGKIGFTWSKSSGPGQVLFTAPQSDFTEAQFFQKGMYELQVEAKDGAASAKASAKVRVNGAPQFSIGLEAPKTAEKKWALACKLIDDGLFDKASGDKLTFEWAKVSGPGEPKFSDATSPDTFVKFPIAGVYVVKLTVRQTVKTASVTVSASDVGN